MRPRYRQRSLIRKRCLFRVLASLDFVPGTPYGRDYDIDCDDERFIMIESAAAATTATQIVVIANFADELKAKMAEAGQ